MNVKKWISRGSAAGLAAVMFSTACIFQEASQNKASAMTFEAWDASRYMVGIDRVTVSIDEGRSGVPIYINTGDLPFDYCEFGVKVDERCKRKITTDPDTASSIGGLPLDCVGTACDSVAEINTTWITCQRTKSISKARIALLYVTLPETAQPGDRYKISYVAEASDIKNPLTGEIKYHFHAWKNNDVDYLEEGLFSVREGWIQVEWEEGPPSPSETLTYENYGDYIEITGCDELAEGELIIPEEIEGLPVASIGSYAFYGHSGLTSVIIPDTVTDIGMSAFDWCENLTIVTFGKNIKELGFWTFGGTNLKSVTIPGGIEELGYGVFADCTNLVSVAIEEGATCLMMGVFQNCTNLKFVAIPRSVTSIAEAFMECKSLTDIYYAGTEEEWNEIWISEDGNEALFNATIHFNSSIPGESTPADLDGNGKITVADAVLLYKYLHALEPLTAEQLTAADLNGDGECDVLDLVLLKRKLLNDNDKG